MNLTNQDNVHVATTTAQPADLRLSTLQAVKAAIADRDRECIQDQRRTLTHSEVYGVLAALVQQKEDSAALSQACGQLELAERERAEIAIIEDYLPAPTPIETVGAAVLVTAAGTGAKDLKHLSAVA